jgi:hypothetical protein
VHAEVIDRSAAVPPNTPLAWASSTIMMQPNSSAASQSAGSAPRSPSMLKTPSVMSKRAPRIGRARQVSCTTLARPPRPCAGTRLIAARLRRHPSMMLAWFSSSDTTTSSLVSSAETVPAFAAKPL